jgi:hypothetical protein
MCIEFGNVNQKNIIIIIIYDALTIRYITTRYNTIRYNTTRYITIRCITIVP